MSDLLALFNSLNDACEVRNTYQRAPFGYPGGKSRSLKEILPHLPYRKKWIDVFGGSGVVTLNRASSPLEIYNDRWSGVVAFYRVLRDPALIERLIARLHLTVHSREEFLWSRETWQNCQDDVERAARWFYVIDASVINKGDAFARATKVGYKPNLHEALKSFWPIHERFKNVIVENLDWSQCFRDFDSRDAVFYCDPPYMFTDHGSYHVSFNEQDHKNLLSTIHGSQGFVALSGFPSELYDSYTWDRRIEWECYTTTRVQAFLPENNLEGMEDELKNQHVTKEVLWIKEARS
jgi:DNA adenine methylase